MFIHITFANKSNPYVRCNMNEKQFRKEKAKWDEHYILKITTDNVTGKFYKAYEKESI